MPICVGGEIILGFSLSVQLNSLIFDYANSKRFSLLHKSNIVNVYQIYFRYSLYPLRCNT